MTTRSRLSVQRGWVEERRQRKNKKTVYLLRYRIRDEAAPNGWWLCSETAPVRSKRAAQRLLQQRILDVNKANGCDHAPQWQLTFEEFARTIWQQYLEHRGTKPSTRYSYGSILTTYVLPLFGGLLLEELTPALLSTFFARLHQKGLSPQTRLNIYALLRTMCVVAVEHDLIAASPVRQKLHRPTVRRTEKPRLSPEEIRRILAQIPRQHAALFAVLAVTGLRIGEVLALRWRNIDRNRQTLTVTHAIWRGALDTPKTAGSEATLHLPDQVIAALDAHRQHRRSAEAFVFARRDGSALDPNYLRKFVLYPALDAAGIERGDRTHGFHLFRHSAASIVHDQTHDLKLTQTLLRHTQLSTTADIYVHHNGNDARLATETLAAALLAPHEQRETNCSPYCSPEGSTADNVH